MLHAYSLGLVFAIAPALSLGDNKFTEPGPDGAAGQYQSNPVYDIGDRMDMVWDSDFKYMDVILWQDYPAGGNNTSFLVKLEDNTTSTSTVWTVSTDGFSTDVPQGEDLVFYLTLYQNEIDNIQAWSHYFNVSLDSAAASTATTVSATASGAIETGYPTSSATASATGSRLSTGAVAGVANRRVLSDTTAASQLTPETSQPAPPYSSHSPAMMQPHELSVEQKPLDVAEVSGEQASYELPSSQAYGTNIPGLHEAP
ncbi:hypothetical protein ACHAPJ_012660 [Fusarium lateritium]